VIQPVAIVGLGLGPEDLTEAQSRVIERAEVLVGGRRHLGYFSDHRAEKREITRDLDGLVDFIRAKMATCAVVVLASGDPLFYGIGGRLIQALGPDNVTVYSNITAVAAAFARVKVPWETAAVVSLHGRSQLGDLWRALESHDHVAVFTDPSHNPAWLAQALLEKGVDNWRMAVLEQMGGPEESIRWLDLASAVNCHVQEPNLVILQRQAPKPRPLTLGAPDHWYAHTQGLITKAEVRVISLAKLRLAAAHVLWDLGAGSGSVAIEAALFVTRGQIFAVEKDPARVAMIRANASCFKVSHLTVVEGRVPEGLDKLPRPDRIFIGGGGKDLGRIIRSAAGYLQPGGVIVVNTVLLANIGAARQAMEEMHMVVDTIEVQIGRSRSMPWDERIEALNPVWIVVGNLKLGPRCLSGSVSESVSTEKSNRRTDPDTDPDPDGLRKN